MRYVLHIVLVLCLTSCSSVDERQLCPLEILDLSLEDPGEIVGEWVQDSGRSDRCEVLEKTNPPLRLLITLDSVFVFYGGEAAGVQESFVLQKREGTLGNDFLEFDDSVVLLTQGDSLLVDNRFRDGFQMILLRE